MDTSDPVDVLSRTLWGEARSTGASGMRNVASVVLNRAAHPRWWGNGVISVCLEPYQFSCWLASDPNCEKLKQVTSQSDPWFTIAIGIANSAISGKLIDQTVGADSYYALSMPHAPSWVSRATHTYSDGWHSFWRVELAAPSGQPESPNTGSATVPPKSSPDTSADDLNAQEENIIEGQS